MKTRNQTKTTMAAAAVMAGILSANAALLVYEPFAYPDGSLTGQGGALGTTGTWASFESLHPINGWRVHQEGATSGIVVAPGPPVARNMFDGTVTNLPTLGGYVGLPGPLDLDPPADPDADFEIGRYMDASIALDPSVTAKFQSGTVTWFSYVAVHAWDRNEETPNLTIGTDPTVLGNRAFSMQNGGSGISAGGGPPRNNRPDVLPRYYLGGASYNLNGAAATWQDDSKEAPDATATMPWVASDADGFGAVNIIVGKIEWDADTGGEDIISVACFLETDVLSEAAFDALIAAKPGLSSRNWLANKPNLNQSQFDTLNIGGTKYFVDEVRIATTFAEVIGGGAPAGLQLTLRPASPGPGYDLAWNSKAGKLYNLRSNPDLSGAISNWTVVQSNLVATPPANTLIVPLSAEPQRFFAVEEFPSPPRLAEDFESGAPGWTMGSDGAGGTAWELGTPTNVGPATAHSLSNCFGSNLGADYGVNANIWLRSPVIDLTTAPSATLQFWQFKNIESGRDSGSVRVLDASDNSELAVVVAVVDGTTANWEQVSLPLPPAALGRPIKLEFRFRSDGDLSFAGWYIDDVMVTVP